MTKTSTHILFFFKFGYAMPDENRRLNEKDTMKVKDLTVFDEKDPEQHIMKLLYGLGRVIGCRGGEYTNFLVSQILRGGPLLNG